MKWPWISREKHERIVSAIHLLHEKQIERMGETNDRLVCGIRSGLARILDKFARVSLSCLHNDPRTWRIVFDLDPRPIIFSLEKGDDHFMIEQIAEELKHKVIRELRSMNIQHPADLGLER